MDFIVKLPKSQGYNSILTITDQGCTKMAIFLPCNESINAEGVAQLYFNYVFPRFGVPSKNYHRPRPPLYLSVHERIV